MRGWWQWLDGTERRELIRAGSEALAAEELTGYVHGPL